MTHIFKSTISKHKHLDNTNVSLCIKSEFLWFVFQAFSVLAFVKTRVHIVASSQHLWCSGRCLCCAGHRKIHFNGTSLSSERMAWACCLTISKEWNYSESGCHDQHRHATRTERRSCSACCIWCVCSKFYTRLGFCKRGLMCTPQKSVKPWLFVFFGVSNHSWVPHFRTAHRTDWQPTWTPVLQQLFDIFQGCGLHREYGQTYLWRRLASAAIRSVPLNYRV